MKKNNIRSFRFDDALLERLQKTQGNSLNEKFENLVNTCYEKLPKIEEKIKEREKYYNELLSSVVALRDERLKLSEDLSKIRDVQRALVELGIRICDIKDNL